MPLLLFYNNNNEFFEISYLSGMSIILHFLFISRSLRELWPPCTVYKNDTHVAFSS